MSGSRVMAVSRGRDHSFSKPNVESITLLAGIGVEGDAHAGTTVKHRSRVARDPTQPNLRQVHLIHQELFDELRPYGFDLTAGQLGENVTTRDIRLLSLPAGTRLHLGGTAVVQVTGLRNPCHQIDTFRPGLLAHLVGRDDNGEIVRKAGIMSVVLAGGIIRPGDPIEAALPAEPHRPLDRV